MASPLLGAKIEYSANEKDAGKDDKFGLIAPNNKTSEAYWVVSYPSAAQRTLATIDHFIAAVDSKRAALGAIQNHFPAISSPHKTSSKPDILAVLNSFERMATFRWFFCA
ncbi:hypothetical protein [Anaerobiospirillum succiniciproducens]|uniref:hypothetical protein n=1 Tax=Anaerobiospirillum succiniciproducens TaxID=13335 RepID=UPI003F8A8151